MICVRIISVYALRCVGQTRGFDCVLCNLWLLVNLKIAVAPLWHLEKNKVQYRASPNKVILHGAIHIPASAYTTFTTCVYSILMPRDVMHKHSLYHRMVSVCPSRSCIRQNE